jgi:hypothetical protein
LKPSLYSLQGGAKDSVIAKKDSAQLCKVGKLLDRFMLDVHSRSGATGDRVESQQIQQEFDMPKDNTSAGAPVFWWGSCRSHLEDEHKAINRNLARARYSTRYANKEKVFCFYCEKKKVEE